MTRFATAVSGLNSAGPLCNTLEHFLQMILENRVGTVVMLTATEERNESTGKQAKT